MRSDVMLTLACGAIVWRMPSVTWGQATDTPPVPGVQQFAGWTERVCLSSAYDQARKQLWNTKPRIVGQGDHLLAFWLCGYGGWRGDVFPRPGPWLAKAESTDAGSTWSPPRWVTPFIVEGFRLQWGQNTVHLAYSARIDPAKWSTSEVFYARSDDNGDTWSTPAQLSFSPHKDLAAYSPAVLAEDDTTVHVAWHQQGFEGQTAGVRDDEIRYRRSDDGGVTWGTTQALGRAADDWQVAPFLWLSGGALRAAFGTTRGAAVLCTTRDHGLTWSPPEPLPCVGPPMASGSETRRAAFDLPWGTAAVADGNLLLISRIDDEYWPGGGLGLASVDPERGVTSLRDLRFSVAFRTVGEGTATAMVGCCSMDAIHVHDREIHLVVCGGSHVVSPDDGRSWSLSTLLPKMKWEVSLIPSMLTDLYGTHILYVDHDGYSSVSRLHEGASIWYIRRPPSDAVDMIPPAPVTDLSASRGNGKVILRWTAPGDDGTIGAASHYFVRYNQTPLASENWRVALDVSGEPNPAPAGTAESMEAAIPLPAGTYHFGIISQDDVGNVSLLSNDAALDIP